MLRSPLTAFLQPTIPPDLLPYMLIVAGIGVSLAEALAPGAHLIVLGVALLAAGLIGLLLGPSLAGPIVLGVLVLVFGALALYGYREFDLYGGKGSGKTSDSASLKGRTARVTERVTPTQGEVKLDEGGGFNPYYAARSVSGEIPEGSEVMVVDPGGGNVITVESFEGTLDDIDRELARGRSNDGEGRSSSDDEDGETVTDDSETETEQAKD
ncbi:membrane protease regulatory membrane protein [Halogeometricum borinquense DSM 11551]|uniref:Membrane protease regulatory membrane protein n=2 Tax=Halogeometricum borinquense TaxID=60847 RepID=E4NRD2_HALBP|nr:NfeD family protein [Halogeometricum borinquense]ADQ67973.1 membrane protein implicated in regulation of membrane protease activity [Halogeometricum borinquense DSM 11551]ELY24106.1 membrane protease regulatory membrane protein [Halogeometricum borinquense DSM 11551]RYJ13103.1 NfeD family protein [Halogeometricum borinquense]